MFVDARELLQDYTVDVDVCIVGAGPAGITLARDLAGDKRTIAVLESGGFEFDADTQQLYSGEVVGHAYMPLDRDRLRFLGGTSNHWEGSCRPFDAMDLADWPIGLDVLGPYYRRAHEICQLGPYSFDAQDWADEEARPLMPGAGANLKSGVFQFSPPTRFGIVYRDDLAAAHGVTVYLNANLVDIETNDNADRVIGLKVACLNGKRLRARAKHYVLAAGGIENARLLLNANRIQKSGLGNAFDQVGRYFMDHAGVVGAATVMGDPASPELRFYGKRAVRGSMVEGFFCASDEVRRRERLPPFAISLWALDNISADYPDEIAPPRVLRNLLPDSVSNKITYYLTRSASLLQLPEQWAYEKMWHQLPGRFTTFYICGPDPDPTSRVSLINGVDALGMRRVQLDWRLPEDFELQMRRAHELLALDLGRTGRGRLRMESNATGHDPMKTLSNGHHHMGTTRMHDDPQRGVVDANCRMHGIANLFIGGSSVFPSYACDNPTMTIVALALRLSDHLKSTLSS